MFDVKCSLCSCMLRFGNTWDNQLYLDTCPWPTPLIGSPPWLSFNAFFIGCPSPLQLLGRVICWRPWLFLHLISLCYQFCVTIGLIIVSVRERCYLINSYPEVFLLEVAYLQSAPSKTQGDSSHQWVSDPPQSLLYSNFFIYQ